KDGFFYSRNNWLLADGDEHAITLHKELVVSGFATDAETKQAIGSFKTIPGSGPQSWERHTLVQGTNGQYKLTFQELKIPFLIRIEADGYEVAISEPLDPNISNLTWNVELQKQNPHDAV